MKKFSIEENNTHLFKMLQRISEYESAGLSKDDASRLGELERLRDLGQELLPKEKIDYERITAKLKKLNK